MLNIQLDPTELLTHTHIHMNTQIHEGAFVSFVRSKFNMFQRGSVSDEMCELAECVRVYIDVFFSLYREIDGWV